MVQRGIVWCKLTSLLLQWFQIIEGVHKILGLFYVILKGWFVFAGSLNSGVSVKFKSVWSM